MDRIFTHNRDIALNSRKNERIPPQTLSCALYTIIISNLFSTFFTLLCIRKIYQDYYWVTLLILVVYITLSLLGFCLKNTKLIIKGIAISTYYPGSCIGICIYGYICNKINSFEFAVWLSLFIIVWLTGVIILCIASHKTKITPLNIEKTYLYFTNEGIHGDSFINSSRKNKHFIIPYNQIINTYQLPVSINDNQYCNLHIESTQGIINLPIKDPDKAITFIHKALIAINQGEEINLPEYLPSGKYY